MAGIRIAVFCRGSRKYCTRCTGSLIVIIVTSGATPSGPSGGNGCSRRTRPLPSRAIVLVVRRSMRLPSASTWRTSVVASARNGAPVTVCLGQSRRTPRLRGRAGPSAGRPCHRGRRGRRPSCPGPSPQSAAAPRAQPPSVNASSEVLLGRDRDEPGGPARTVRPYHELDFDHVTFAVQRGGNPHCPENDDHRLDASHRASDEPLAAAA